MSKFLNSQVTTSHNFTRTEQPGSIYSAQQQTWTTNNDIFCELPACEWTRSEFAAQTERGRTWTVRVTSRSHCRHGSGRKEPFHVCRGYHLHRCLRWRCESVDQSRDLQLLVCQQLSADDQNVQMWSGWMPAMIILPSSSSLKQNTFEQLILSSKTLNN